ncbi:hypothetical protein SNEBB_008195 [Seison nebaliae]|nr:hypothetical protein SNEBB_008195 [Seison nebaliae]
MSKCSIVGIGNPLLDICISGEDAKKLLKKYNLKANDAILADDSHLPLFEELEKRNDVDYIAGGATQNSMRICAGVLGKEYVGNVGFFGCVGKDTSAKILEDIAQSAGVDVHYDRSERSPTGKCAVLVTDNHRSLITKLDAANDFSMNHLKEDKIMSIIEHAQTFYLSGFFLTVSPETVVQIGRLAMTNKNQTMILNTSAPFICEFFVKNFRMVFPFVDILFGNEDEMGILGKTYLNKKIENGQIVSEKMLEEIASELSTIDLDKKMNIKQRTIIITRSEKSLLTFHNNQMKWFNVPKADNIVDTNGAGDAFVGGFLASFFLKQSFDKNIEKGIELAKIVLGEEGCVLPKTK